MEKETARLYRQFRKSSPFMLVGHMARQALDAAKILKRFRELESKNLVKLEVTPDEDFDWSDLDDECREQYGDDGAWQTATYWRASETDDWQIADCCCGHVGYDDPGSPFENCHVIDEMREAIRQYENATLGSLSL
jgi:hypothetical protein